MHHFLAPLACALMLAGAATFARAEVLAPQDDAEVVEILPAAGGSRAEERALRRRWAANPTDAGIAVALARRYIDQARAAGDPRYAGRALAALQAWPEAASAPAEVLLMRATVQQYLHAFDESARTLERLVTREPQHAQAWLTLATVRRVQGRYAESDVACAALARVGSPLYAQACRAENDGLRGNFDAARTRLHRLLAAARDAATRNWLLTSIAEFESRAGRPVEADAAYRAALAARADAYTTLSYVDFLLQQDRRDDARVQLRDQARSDAVLLRLAIAGRNAQSPEAREMRERLALAALRPEARTTHAREQAMFALWVDHDAERALALARENVRHQREPLDLLVLAHAARAAGDAGALGEAATLAQEIGLHDLRLEALL